MFIFALIMISPAEYTLMKKIRQGEGLTLDFKYAVTDSRKIAKTLSAFANTAGGTLLIGVKDDGTIRGVRSEEEIYMVEAAATLYCRPALTFTSVLWKIHGEEILELTIEPYKDEVVLAEDDNKNWKAYYRFEDSNHPLHDIYIQVQKRKKNEKGLNIQIDDNYRSVLDIFDKHKIISWTELNKLSPIYRQKLKKILIELILVELVDFHFTREGLFYKAKK